MSKPDPSRPVRRCLCHKFIIHVERDDAGAVVKRFCIMGWRPLKKEQTYLATYGSEEPYQPPAEAPVQRGMRMDG